MRVAIYSRYSSDLQDPRSIGDQIAAARDHAQRQGWTVVGEFQDAAISGASIKNRPGLNALLGAADARAFDAVLTESVDRLSRDQEDLAHVYKRLVHIGIKIITLADGAIGKLHVGIKGMLASMFLDDLALKTKRGQVGRVKAGRIPGGLCYGYDVVPSIDERGQRTINEAEAAIVRRIFDEYIAGRSGLKIATDLNAEKIPAPRGGTWCSSVINGNTKRGNGIINNRLYTGKIIFNRQSFVKDPATGKRQARENPRDQWLEQDVPELRIISDEIFAAAQNARRQTSTQRLDTRRRPKHLLSGLVFCGCCRGSLTIIRDDYLGCSASRNRGTCNNRRTIRSREIQDRILAALQKYLLSPDVVEVAVEAYRQEREQMDKMSAREQRDVERDLATVERKIQSIVSAIEDGGEVKAMVSRLNELEAQRVELERRRPRAVKNVVSLHPKAAEAYAGIVGQLHQVLGKGQNSDGELVEIVRGLIERIDVTPAAPGEPLKLDLAGNLTALLAEPNENPTAVVMVAGAGFEPTTFRL